MAGKLLIVDDVATNRIVLKAKLASAGYRPAMAAEAGAALVLAAGERPDLVLLAARLPGTDTAGLIARLRALPGCASLPVVVMTDGSGTEARLAALRAGADDALARPFADEPLLALIRSFMRHRTRSDLAGPAETLPLMGMAEPAAAFERPACIALVTARPETALRLRRDLVTLPHDICVLTPEEALAATLQPEGPDAFVIEADLASPGAGLRLMSDLQSRPVSCHAAFLILMAEGCGGQAAMAYDLGAQGLMSPAAPGAEAALRLSRLIARKRTDDRRRASVQDGLRLAMIDPLTGLHNRRYASARLSAIAEAAARDRHGFAVMVVDLDRFKSVNDRWGHAAGDAVLVEVAARLTQALRAGDLLARIGGEEFLAALPRAGLAEAEIVAARLCHAVEERPVRLPSGLEIAVTVSVGVAIAGGHDDCGLRVREAVEQADRALMRSKSGGRNQVTVFRSAA
jgi:two-component system cell cycle response regulator